MLERFDTRMSVQWLAAIVLGAVILCWPAYLNGFPLIYADTANYIGQVKLRSMGWNAPPFYSAFLSTTDLLSTTLWTPILAQGLIASSLLAITLDQFGFRRPWSLLAACLGLSVFTSLPWVTSQLIADFFTGVAVLSLALLAFADLSRWQRVYLLLLATFAVAAHQSHIPLAFGLLLAACAIRGWQNGRQAALQVFCRIAPAPLLAAALVFSVNLFGLGRPAISPFGNVVLVARMVGDGTALSYLHAACPRAQYRVCAHLDELEPGGTIMLWDRPALWDALGGHKAWVAEADRIVRGTIAYDPGAVIAAAIDNSIQQFAAMQTGETLRPWLRADGPRPLIARFYPGELAAFDHSRQQTGRLEQDIKPLEALHVAVAWLGVAGLLTCAWLYRRDRLVLGLCLMVLLAAVGNAFITGALSEVQNRYTARLAWVLPLVSCLVLARQVRAGAFNGS
jgi:hypothetical protein